MDTQDISTVPSINFTFVDDFITHHSKSSGEKEVTKGFRYFAESYIHHVRGKVHLDTKTLAASIVSGLWMLEM